MTSAQDKEYYLYRHIRLDTNQVFYVGIGTKRKYYASHVAEYSRAHSRENRNNHWNRIVAKTDIRVEIIYETFDSIELINKEIEFISLYGRRDLGTGTLVNLTSGGEGINGISDKTRESMSRAKQGTTRTDETKEKIRKAVTGRKHSDETKYKCSLINLGRVSSQETRDKISKASKERFKDPEERKKYRHSSSNIYLDLQTGIYYEYLKDACLAANYSYTRAKTNIKRKVKHIRFIRVNDEVENLTKTK